MAFSSGGLSREEAQQLVEQYGHAWAAQDTDKFLEIFHDDGVYYERPDRKIEGEDALKEYWERTVVKKQSNVQFKHELDCLIVDPETNMCCAKWEVKFDIDKGEGRTHKLHLITRAIIRFKRCDFGNFKIATWEEFSNPAEPRDNRSKGKGKSSGKGKGKKGAKGKGKGGSSTVRKDDHKSYGYGAPSGVPKVFKK